jgi:hypothetical protein
VRNDQDRIEMYERHSRGEIDEEVARVLLGDRMDTMAEEREAFDTATNRDTSDFLTEWRWCRSLHKEAVGRI